MLLQLCLFVVTVIELTSSQSTYDVIQQENDVNSCERTEQLQTDMQMISAQLNNVQLVNSQLMGAVSQLQRDVQQIQLMNSRLMKAVAELKTGKQQNETKGTSGARCNSNHSRHIINQSIKQFLGGLSSRAAVGMGIPMGFPWVWVWYGYRDCDESPWVLWVICGDF